MSAMANLWHYTEANINKRSMSCRMYVAPGIRSLCEFGPRSTFMTGCEVTMSTHCAALHLWVQGSVHARLPYI